MALLPKNQTFVGTDSIPSGPGPFVTVHVRDVPALVKAQGGAIGELVVRLAPQAIENQVYEKMATQIAAGMKDKGVDAEVKIVTNPHALSSLPSRSDFVTGMALGAGSVFAVYGIYRLIKHFV